MDLWSESPTNNSSVGGRARSAPLRSALGRPTRRGAFCMAAAAKAWVSVFRIAGITRNCPHQHQCAATYCISGPQIHAKYVFCFSVMWVQHCHLHHPPGITIVIGGMFTIPSYGWFISAVPGAFAASQAPGGTSSLWRKLPTGCPSLPQLVQRPCTPRDTPYMHTHTVGYIDSSVVRRSKRAPPIPEWMAWNEWKDKKAQMSKLKLNWFCKWIWLWIPVLSLAGCYIKVT